MIAVNVRRKCNVPSKNITCAEEPKQINGFPLSAALEKKASSECRERKGDFQKRDCRTKLGVVMKKKGHSF